MVKTEEESTLFSRWFFGFSLVAVEMGKFHGTLASKKIETVDISEVNIYVKESSENNILFLQMSFCVWRTRGTISGTLKTWMFQ